MNRELVWISDADPVLIDKYQKLPMLEYYAILDYKLGEIKQEIARARSENQRSKRNGKRFHHD